MLDWYRLLGDLGVPYRDHGKNTSKKDINICCPFCQDDFGYHMGISLDNPTNYHCFRDGAHSGKSYPWLLKALGCDKGQINSILGEYDGAIQRAVVSPPEPSEINAKWARFRPAAESQKVVDYLISRGFRRPIALTERYDLRYAPDGAWAMRILLPFKENGNVVSWAGRALVDSITPKMLMQENRHPGLLYIPRKISHKAVLVEGQFDALKIAEAVETYAPVAISGKSLTDSKIVRLIDQSKDLRELYLAYDADVNLSTRMATIRELRASFSRKVSVFSLTIPKPYKDPGEMPVYAIREWLL